MSDGVPAAVGVEPAVSVRDLLDEPSFGLRLLAGRDRVGAPVRWVMPTELVDPRPYLHGQELVLTVGSALGEPDHCRALVEHLEAASVTGLGYGVGDVTEEVPAALVEACRDHGLPLLRVPQSVPFQSISMLLADRRAEARARRTHRLQRLVVQLLDAVAEGRSVHQLERVVEAELGGRVAFDGHRVTWTALAEEDLDPGEEALAHVGRVLAVRQQELVADLAARRQEVGRLLELVLQGRADVEVLRHPLRSAGVDLERTVVPVAWPAGGVDVAGVPASGLLVADLPHATVTLGHDPDPLLAAAAAKAVVCGAGAPAPWSELRAGVAGALAALRMARAQGASASFRDLATLRGLLEQQPPERLAPFVEATVSPLLAHDRVHRTTLVATLRQYLSSEGTVAATAEEMFIHPNSLRYRLRTIERLTGLDLKVFDDRVTMAVGLWAHDQAVGRGGR